MKKRRPPIKPFVYGKYIVEYREKKGGLLRFYKEHIDNIKDANKLREKLINEGYYNPVVKRIG
jgi:hypothetical protein|tara:strand:+ start:1844 stop:2032 length:189 start_codon:yes stop_codon:yes gene_type:complete